MYAQQITEKLVKVTLGMIENDNCGVLSLDNLVASLPGLSTDNPELLYADCKTAAETATQISTHFTRPVLIVFEQRERILHGSYVPDHVFMILWESPAP